MTRDSTRRGAGSLLVAGAAALALVASCGDGSQPSPVPSTPTIASFAATPPTISPGGSSTLAWSVTGADAIAIDHGIGAVTGSSVTVSPAVTTTYMLTATNTAGSTTAQATVTVQAPPAKPVIASFTASPSTIPPGASSTLAWSVTGADTIEIDQGIGQVAGSKWSVFPAVTTTYTLTATNSAGSSTAQATVTVQPPPAHPVIASFTAMPPTIPPGGSSTLAWSVTGADTIEIDPGIGTVTGSSVSVSPAVTTTYTLVATNVAGSSLAHATVTVSAWIGKAPLPTPRADLAAVAWNGKIYALGGSKPDELAPLATVEMYDPVADTWTSRASTSTARDGLAGVECGGLVYALGGLGASGLLNSLEAYDPLTDTWTARAPMATFRHFPGAAVANGKIYAMGGWGGSNLATVEEYDPGADAWVPRAAMPEARHAFFAATVNGKVYVVGGAAGVSLVPAATVLEYDPVANTWATKAPMATARFYLAGAVLDGKIYALGGNDGVSWSASVEVYDPATNAWTSSVPMPSGRVEFAAAAVGGKIYAIGGTSDRGPLVEEFWPP